MADKKRKQTTIGDDIALSKLLVASSYEDHNLQPKDWIRLLQTYLRMTQAELAKRAKITQANLAAIESGTVDPRIGTLQRIYQRLSCHLNVEPRPQQPLEDIIRGRARAIALQRLNKMMGNMALEEQALEEEVFRKLLEKRTDEILHDPREKLWRQVQDD
jgi:transcriptional regulator with XRE-family HTH domain